MSKLFPKLNIDINEGKIYSIKYKKEVFTCINSSGYLTGYTKDCFGSSYHGAHEVIIAEALQLPKHLWPIDEKGQRFVVNHIQTGAEGKLNNKISNLELCSYHYNNVYDEKHIKTGNKLHNRQDLSKPVNKFALDWTLIEKYPSASEAARQNGVFVNAIINCCNKKRRKNGWLMNKTIKGYYYRYE